MLRLLMPVLVAGLVLPYAAQAQTAAVVQQGFGFCTVTDTSRAQATIWASPVLTLEYLPEDPGGFQRGQDLAGDFLAHVGTLGGKGLKSCVVLASQAEAANFREEQRATWDKRMYFVKIGDWRDVAWVPPAWSPATVNASAAPVTRYFQCSATQTDIPDLGDLSRTVATAVFSMPVPAAGTQAAMYAQADAYRTQFQRVVQAHGLPVKGSCIPYDTLAEAQYAYQQNLRFNKGFNMKYNEVAWTPSASTPATPAPAMTAAPAASTAIDAQDQLPALGLLRVDPMTAALSESLGCLQRKACSSLPPAKARRCITATCCWKSPARR